MENILITGGAGFIGSHLCEKLLMEGNRIIIIDNFNNYYDPSIKIKNIKYIKKTMQNNNIPNNKFIIHNGDIRNVEILDQIFQEKIDMVIHLAAMAGVRPSIENARLYYDVNINGTLNLLEKCKEKMIKKFIFASSSSVYGDSSKVPFSEEDKVDSPISPYAASKKAGELLCYTYHHLYDLNVACLRFFTVYGPRQRPDLAIHKFTKLIMENKPIPFYGDGSTERNYTYIDDIINGITNTIIWVNNVGKRYEIFNLGGNDTISLKQMVRTIENVTGKKAKLNIMPMQSGDVTRTCADITHAKNVLGFMPKVNFTQGIENFVKWYKNLK